MKRGTPQHPKVIELAEILGVPWLYAVGLLEVLWHTTARYAPQGNIGKWSDENIASHFEWRKSPSKLIEALVSCGWLDRDPDYRLLVHDWDEHADQSVRKTLKNNGQDFIHPAREQTIYFILAEQSGLVKIGLTGRHVMQRLSELQANFPEHLRVVYTKPGGFEMETYLHDRFKHLKTRGEWFVYDNEISSYINEIAQSFPEMVHPYGQTHSTNMDAPSSPQPQPLPQPLPQPQPSPAQTGTTTIAADWPETDAVLTEIWPSCDDADRRSIVDAAAMAYAGANTRNGKVLTDRVLASAIRASPRPKFGARYFIKTVPTIIQNWVRDAQRSQNES